jgi:uncharacterized membrane protein
MVHASELGGAVPSILIAHIAAGTLSVVAGGAALYFAKGSAQHRASGNVFFVAMMAMAVTGSYLAALIQDVSVFGGIFAFYLVATAWATVKRKENSTGFFEIGALVFILGVAGLELTFAVQALNSPSGRFLRYPPGPYFALASVAALAAALDWKVIARGGISGAARIARHLWRMCFALFVALGSFIAQGLRRVVPPTAPEFRYILLLALVPLVLMIFWLIRVRLTKWYTNDVRGSREARTPLTKVAAKPD